MNPVVHFEIPAEDTGRMRKFYESAFGWETQQLGDEMGGYVLVTTAERDAKSGLPKKSGRINGGFFKKTADPISQYPSVVIAVEDINASIKKVIAAGGKLSGKVETIPGYGLLASIIDTEGNRIGMMQPTEEMKKRAN